jgi:hypothetical protein
MLLEDRYMSLCKTSSAEFSRVQHVLKVQIPDVDRGDASVVAMKLLMAWPGWLWLMLRAVV